MGHHDKVKMLHIRDCWGEKELAFLYGWVSAVKMMYKRWEKAWTRHRVKRKLRMADEVWNWERAGHSKWILTPYHKECLTEQSKSAYHVRTFYIHLCCFYIPR